MEHDRPSGPSGISGLNKAQIFPDDAPHLLVVDDDARIRALLQRYLTTQGYRVTLAASAREARQQLAVMVFDLMVLDVMMPGESGLELVTWLRMQDDQQQPKIQVPVLMLTARADTSDRIEGLEAGVDDYLAKPFEPRELSLRISAIIRRAQAWDALAGTPPPEQVSFGGHSFHLDRGELLYLGKILRLTGRERTILRVLACARGRPVSRLQLAGDSAGERTIDVQMNRLRRKIEDDMANPLYLQTVRGAGYKLVLDEGRT